MTVRRILVAAISTVAVLAFNVGAAESASAGTAWHVNGKDQKIQTFGTAWD